MKIKLIICSVFAVLLLTAAASQTKVAAQADVIVGGYADVPVDSKEAKKFARWAVATRSKHTHKRITLVKIVKAEHQVVRGLNHRICMDVREGRHKARRVTVVVWEDINNRPLKLTNWKKGECADI